MANHGIAEYLTQLDSMPIGLISRRDNNQQFCVSCKPQTRPRFPSVMRFRSEIILFLGKSTPVRVVAL